jgi:diaminohydroxyphosphoribosylaminopyrimidine deaminase/5-amino-6-(5-phosphoribosylamino)uracil reductase
MHAFFLRRTLELAEQRRGFCAPNPSVGAVVVREGKILAEGWHTGPGKAHAEVEALKNLSREACQGATLYVSLEPCCHFGRTPPCTDEILHKQLAHVVYAYADPNPLVQGKGHAQLVANGVKTEHFPLAEAAVFYQSYTHWTKNRVPFTTVKLAVSLDGKTAGPQGVPLPITGPEVNRFTHERRLRSDAILTTANTILADDPQMNARVGNTHTPKPLYILDRLGRTPSTARVFSSASPLTFFVGPEIPPGRKQGLAQTGARLIELPAPGGSFSLKQVLICIAEAGCHDLWVEAGGTLFSTFLAEGLADKALLYIAPFFVGEGVSAFQRPWEEAVAKARVSWVPRGRDVVAEMVW